MGSFFEKCVERTGISMQASFDRQHKVANSIEGVFQEGFQGIVESDDIFFLASSKGSRSLEYKLRKHGSKASKRGIDDEQIPVIVICI